MSRLVYVMSGAYRDHLVERRPREEAKRGLPSGHRLPRASGAMLALLLPYATPGWSRITGWDRCHPSGAAADASHEAAAQGLRAVRAAHDSGGDVPQALHGSPRVPSMTAQRGLDVTPIVPATPYHSSSDAERYRRLNHNAISALRLSRIKPVFVQISLIDLQGRVHQRCGAGHTRVLYCLQCARPSRSDGLACIIDECIVVHGLFRVFPRHVFPCNMGLYRVALDCPQRDYLRGMWRA